MTRSRRRPFRTPWHRIPAVVIWHNAAYVQARWHNQHRLWAVLFATLYAAALPATLLILVGHKVSPWHDILTDGRAVQLVWVKKDVWHLYSAAAYPIGSRGMRDVFRWLPKAADDAQVYLRLRAANRRLGRYYASVLGARPVPGTNPDKPVMVRPCSPAGRPGR